MEPVGNPFIVSDDEDDSEEEELPPAKRIKMSVSAETNQLLELSHE